MDLSPADKYAAIINKDRSLEDSFFTCVKTTGIFCKLTCTARIPKFENVEFVDTAKDALTKGYRPCKVCEPMKKRNETPEFVQLLLDEIRDNPALKISDWELKKRNLKPYSVGLWFLKNHGITFHFYQRMFRLNVAFQKVQSNQAFTRVPQNKNHASPNDFKNSFQVIFGVSPKKGRKQVLINLTRFETPIGTLIACAVEDGICLVDFSDRRMLATELKALARHFNANILQKPHAHFNTLKSQLNEYFAGNRKEFSVPLVLPGTAFQKAAWQELLTIPYGSTRTYADQASRLKERQDVQAVRNANDMNRIAIIVPCHRLVGSDGALVGYGGGLWRKRWLIDWEKACIQE